jgi:hypothetical protein
LRTYAAIKWDADTRFVEINITKYRKNVSGTAKCSHTVAQKNKTFRKKRTITSVEGDIDTIDEMQALLSTTHLAGILNIIRGEGSVMDKLAKVGALEEILLLTAQSLTDQKNQDGTPALSSCNSTNWKMLEFSMGNYSSIWKW